MLCSGRGGRGWPELAGQGAARHGTVHIARLYLPPVARIRCTPPAHAAWLARVVCRWSGACAHASLQHSRPASAARWGGCLSQPSALGCRAFQLPAALLHSGADLSFFHEPWPSSSPHAQHGRLHDARMIYADPPGQDGAQVRSRRCSHAAPPLWGHS